MAKGTQPYRAAFWSNQYQPRNKSCPCLAIASRGNKNTPRIELQSTATKIVTKLMNWNQYRVGTLLQRVHTDCLGRKFSPQRSQYTVALPDAGIHTRDRRQFTAFAVPKTTGQKVSFGLGLFSCTKVLVTFSQQIRCSIAEHCAVAAPLRRIA